MAMMKQYVDVFLSPSTLHYISNNTVVGIWWHQFSALFWSSDFWLPSGRQWENIEPSNKFQYPNFHDVWVYPLLLSVGFILFRFFLLEPFVLEPLALAAAVPNKRPHPPPPSKTLETFYRLYGLKPSTKQLVEAADTSDMTVRQVERWLRRRQAITHTTKHDKFIDCGYNLLCHILLFIFGCSIMFYKPWLWNINLCWENHPHHSIDDDVWWYYITGLGYFWAGSFMQINTPARSVADKIHMMLHHMFTILLMVFSWTCNFVRVGTLVFFVHECVDIPLLFAKMLLYAGIQRLTDVIFAVFLISWLITRNYLYPFWIMYSVFVDATPYIQMPAAYLFKGLLIGLLVLNIIWTVLIGGVLMKKLCVGSLEDVRSDGEDLSEDDNTRGSCDKRKQE